MVISRRLRSSLPMSGTMVEADPPGVGARLHWPQIEEIYDKTARALLVLKPGDVCT